MDGDAEVIFGDWLAKLKVAVQNPITTLKRIGALIVSRSQKRFVTQHGPDGQEWPERMTPNIPGILEDLERGAGIKDRRWVGRPALVDYGAMRQSINSRVISTDTVEIGTSDPRATLHHFGLERVIKITATVHQGIAELLGKFHKHDKKMKKWRANPYKTKYKYCPVHKDGTVGGFHDTRKSAVAEKNWRAAPKDWRVVKIRAGAVDVPEPKEKFGGQDLSHLGFLLTRNEFHFKLMERQFIGLDEQDEEDVFELIRDKFLGDAVKGSLQ